MTWTGLDLDSAPVEGPVAFRDDLSPTTLLDGYRHGLYPVPADSDEQQIMNEVGHWAAVADGRIAAFDGGEDPFAVPWLCPDPRPVIVPGATRIQRSLRQQLRNKVDWTTTLNACFDRVLEHCRDGRRPRWMTDRLVAALRRLHAEGHAHSVEVWDGDELVGGTYGVRTGGVFSADSQFGLRSGAAKVAVACLVRRFAAAGGSAVDVQYPSRHAELLGAVEMPRTEYLALLARHDGVDDELPAETLAARSLAA